MLTNIYIAPYSLIDGAEAQASKVLPFIIRIECLVENDKLNDDTFTPHTVIIGVAMLEIRTGRQVPLLFLLPSISH